MDAVYQKVPNAYYYPETGLDGTAKELFIQARNGYIETPAELLWVKDILSVEKMDAEAEYVQILYEIAMQGSKNLLFSVPQMKKDFLDGQYTLLDDVAYNEDGSIKISVVVERQQTVCVCLLDDSGQATCSIPKAEFLKMEQEDFEKTVNAAYYYNREEVEL